MNRRSGAVYVTGVVFALCSAVVRADDWPQWRGAQRDGVWHETGLVSRFEGKQLPLKWQVPVGTGYSGPTVANGRVFLTDRQTEPAEVERVLCFAEDSGAPLWQYQYMCSYDGIGYTAGPRLCDDRWRPHLLAWHCRSLELSASGDRQTNLGTGPGERLPHSDADLGYRRGAADC